LEIELIWLSDALIQEEMEGLSFFAKKMKMILDKLMLIQLELAVLH
jgi:hypothetical protein